MYQSPYKLILVKKRQSTLGLTKKELVISKGHVKFFIAKAKQKTPYILLLLQEY